MPNPSKAKGDRWERELVKFLRDSGFPQAARLRQTGVADEGDLTIGSPLWALEAKDDRSLSPAAMVAQADAEAVAANKPFGVVLRKSPQRPVSEAVVMMSMKTWVRLVRFLEDEIGER